MIIAIADLFEAEGRAFKYATVRLGWELAIIAFAALFAAIGSGLCLWAIFQYLSRSMDMATATLLTGIITLIYVGALAWVVKRLNR